MAVLHKIRTDGKGTKLTPGKSMRKHCLECVGGAADVRNCEGDKLISGGSCPLYRYRLGKGRPSVKTIRKECLNCMGGYREMVRNCGNDGCNLYMFHMGKNPNYTCREYAPETGGQAVVFA